MSELIAVEMRRLKESSQLSFAKLAARTHYSRSSWERFLNGKKPVPREAVEQFVSAVGARAGSLLLMEEPEGTTATSTDDDQRRRHPHRQRAHRRPDCVKSFAAGVALGALAVAAAGLLTERRGAGRRAYGLCPCASDVPGVAHAVSNAVSGVPNWRQHAYDG